MRSYGQYCAVAKALDVVGDRWNLLIVRELALQGPCRYTDLLAGLPGIATNLLAARLNDLEAQGVVDRKAAAPPVATSLFELTERGRELVPVVTELARWGTRFIAQSIVGLTADPQEGWNDERFRIHWLGYPISLFLPDADSSAPDLRLMIRVGDQQMVVERVGGKVTTRPGTTDEAVDLTIEGSPPVIIGILAGGLPLEVATGSGFTFHGRLSVLDQLRGGRTAIRS
jgi:DNA-binding HxlR family transcriptional regulator